MNRDEILSMEPGRELDALVAEYVVGMEEHRKAYPESFDERVIWFRNPPNVIAYYVPFYSTDISAAFEVEEIAIEKDPAMYVHALASVVFGCSQVQDISDIRKMCMLIHATPEQRCKAALLAVTGDVEKT